MTDVVTTDRLRAIVAQIEAVEEEMASLKTDLKEIYAGAKNESFDVRTLKRLIARRRKDEQTRKDEDELLKLYEAAVNGQMKLPLDNAA